MPRSFTSERNSGTRNHQPSLLAGMLFDGDGNRMTPSHAVKMGTHYRYYVSGSLITKDRTHRHSRRERGDPEGRRDHEHEPGGLARRARHQPDWPVPVRAGGDPRKQRLVPPIGADQKCWIPPQRELDTSLHCRKAPTPTLSPRSSGQAPGRQEAASTEGRCPPDDADQWAGIGALRFPGDLVLAGCLDRRLTSSSSAVDAVAHLGNVG